MKKYSKEQIEQINKYGRHQNFLATQGKEAIPFEKWIYDKSQIQ